MDTNSLLLPSYTPGQIAFITFLQQHKSALLITSGCAVSRKSLVDVLSGTAYVAVPAWIAANRVRRCGRGHYHIPELFVDPATLTVNTNTRGRKPGSRNTKGQVTVTTDPATTTVNA